MNSTRLLVIGASGLLGGETLLAAVERGYDTVGVSAHSLIRPPAGASAMIADVAAPGNADDLIRDVRPSLIVNAAASVDLDALESDPDWADHQNTQLPVLLARAAHIADARFVHVSTDAVFDGRHAQPYTEDDVPRPINVYGMSKLNGERAVTQANPDALTVRTTIYGWNASPKRSLAEWFLARMESGEGAVGFADAWFTPINTAHLVEQIFELLARPVWPVAVAANGVLHLAGGECVTKYEFGRRLAKAFGHDPEAIRPGRLEDHDFGAARAGWACLDSSRAASFLGHGAPSVDTGLARLRSDSDSGRRAALRQMGGIE